MNAPVVPDGHTAHCPLPADVVVVGRMDVIFKEVEKFVYHMPDQIPERRDMQRKEYCRTGLLFLQLGEASDKAGVDVQCLQARNRVRPDCRMVSIDGWSIWTSAPKVEDCIVYSA